MATRSPNVLLIMFDQLAARCLPTHGHAVVQTPTLDRLAAEGVVFDAMYTNSPLCGPARMTMMTGRLPSKTGAYDNAAELASATPTFAHHLRRRGYHTCLAGKMHFVGPDQLHGFEERLTTDIYPADFGWTPNWDAAEERVDWWYHNLDSVVRAGIAESTNQLDFDDEVGQRAVRKLRDHARDRGRPWCLTVSFTHPHDPYAIRREHWDRYDHGTIDLPRVGDLAGSADDPHSIRLRTAAAADHYDITDDQIRRARHAYYGAVSYLDDWVARLLRTLGAHGLIDDTIVIFTSDHGDMLGERGLWYKMSFFEPACRVPLIVWAPERFSPRRVADPVSLVDLLPTLVDLAGDEVDSPIDGSSLVSQLAGKSDPSRTVVGEYLAEGAVAPIFMIRRGDDKYVSCAADPPQLYDLSTDPDEMTNLALADEGADRAAAFEVEVDARWDRDHVHAAVLASQRARRIVDGALRQGSYVPWDYEPPASGANLYMRNHLDLNEVEAARRYPRAQ